MAESDSTDPAETDRCDYCRLGLPEKPVTSDHADITYQFCSQACREALEESDRVFTTYHGYRQFQPGLAAMDPGLPEGMPRNALVLLSSQTGTAQEAVLSELVWRTLQRGEPVVILTFLETPTSVVQEFVSLDWNVLPYLESEQLHVLDCFTYRVDASDRIVDRMNEFNRHLHDVVEPATTTVEDPTNLVVVRSRLDDCLEAMGMNDRGIVVIDSLTELGTIVQPVKAYDFVKSLRADVPKGRFVPVFAGATRTQEKDEFPHDLEYLFDGIIDLRFSESTVPDTLLKQLRIRKMAGVLTIPEWHTYEYTAGQGQVVFDPEEEMASDDESDDDADATGDESDDDADAIGDEEPDDAESGSEDGTSDSNGGESEATDDETAESGSSAESDG